MGGIKTRGANLMFKKITNTHPKDLIKTFKLFVGDTVQVTGGRRDVGKIGTILDIVKKRNLVVVKDVAMQVKHMKPNPFYPKGDKILKETPIHYSNVQLVDPSIQ
jgi:large subunit ribosomal protein L24